MMRRRYGLLQATLIALVAHCVAHAWKTGRGHISWGSKVSHEKQNWVNRALLWRLPRGGGEQNDNVDDDSLPTEHEVDSTETEEESENQTLEEDDIESSVVEDGTQSSEDAEQPATVIAPQQEDRKVRHTSDVIVRLVEQNSDLKQESVELRELITNRAQAYIKELSEAEDKPPHPKRVLHYVAPKIPAIKHSPDLMLRVQSFKGGTDTGVAACAIGTVARLCEFYDRRILQNVDEDEFVSVGEEIVRDRRYQQLVECVLCGVDVQRRKKEADKMKDGKATKEANAERDIEEVLDEEEAKIDDGLSVQDSCRAAWGIAVLSGFRNESFCDVTTEDILTALSLRSRELLLARLQLLREGETLKEDKEGSLTLVERLDQDAEELAEDAAAAMWTFACVKACTGVRSVPLFDACCTILCQNPVDLRERAKEEREGLDGSTFDVNDVVDKLQRSESDEMSTKVADGGNFTSISSTNVNATVDPEKGTTRLNETTVDSKDALLDWLTPNEVTDVLWALALHGSTVDTDSKEEVALSETAAAFREIAFDRLVGWLRRDLDIIEQEKDDGTNSSVLATEGTETEFIKVDHFDRSVDGVGAEETLVEVVDASTVLASSATMETELVTAMNNAEAEDEGNGVQQVQVVDAATLLACTPEVPLEAETELLVASTLARSYESLDDEADAGEPPSVSFANQNVKERNAIGSDVTAIRTSAQLSFSPHDLCSIAWAVTDLRDPLRYLIVDLITQMFSSLGSDSLQGLSMADLSNLAWAIARSASQKQTLSYAEYSKAPAAAVTRWTAEAALARLRIDGRILEDRDVALAVRSVIQEFQPPELGRLLWSFACTEANYIDPLELKKERDDALSQLATLALLAAGSNMSIFSTEDLTRIAWAFMELCDTKTALSQPLVAESLGCVLAAIESSLLVWEGGPRTKSVTHETKRAEDSLHFSTFFGRSRFPLRLLNQMIHEQEDEEEGQRSDRKSSLPLLRDLPVDPSSLCKLSSAYSRLCQEQRDVMGGWTFVRIAVRLLSSKNGQLMEQCPLIDVIGLCHACAISEVNGRERGQVVRLFAGRVVQFMNDALDPDPETHGKAAARLDRATPWEVATLIWSIGELGARHFTSDENRRMAHRKLRLITDRPLLSDDDLQTLSVASTVNLLHGISLLNMASSDPEFVSSVAQALVSKLASLETGKEIVDVAMTAAKLRRATERLAEHPPTEDTTTTDSKQTAKEDAPENGDDRKEINATLDKVTTPLNVTAARNDILEAATELLTKVSTVAMKNIRDLSATEMSDLLLVYPTLPFQADDLVATIEEETSRRLEILSFKGPTESVQDLARRAFDSSVLATNTLSGESESSSTVDTIKNGIKAIFGVHDISEEASEEDVALLAALAENTQRTTTLIRETLGRMEQIRQGTGQETESLLRGIEQGTAIELGRCQELVAVYRRIDFATDYRQSRYDSARRRVISKRILSRLFP